MDVLSVALISNLVGSILFLILTILLLINWRGQLVGGLLILAGALSTLWFSAIAYNAAMGEIQLAWIKVLETLRSTVWLCFLYVVLRYRPQVNLSRHFKVVLPIIIALLCVGILYITLFISETGNLYIAVISNISFTYLGYLLMALLGLIMLEQFYRHTLINARWTIKYLCLGIGGIFAYDFFLYSEALLFNRINPDLWFVRGAINGLCVPLIVVAVSRNPQWKMELFVSRQVVYQSSAATVAGAYLLSMAIIGYYIKNFGGTWGTALQVTFVFVALMFLFVAISSEQLRTKLKVFLQNNFYKNKYDYRQEWLHITRILAENRDDSRIYGTIISAIAEIMKCPGGAIWLCDDRSGFYTRKEAIMFHDKVDREIELGGELVTQILMHHPVINFQQFGTNPAEYKNLKFPESILQGKDVAVFIALINDDELLGFILLTHPHTKISFNYEDVDLLKTIGYQIAGYIALLRATDSLAEARQFEVFNRLSAFVVHDIKNLVAQLSLINANAKKFRDEPEFIEDVFDTIDNSVSKMKRLLANLQKGEILGAQSQQIVKVGDIIEEVISLREVDLPVPTLKKSEINPVLNIEKDKLVSVLEHLIQNAQEATAADGEVRIAIEQNEKEVKIEVKDTGSGMDEVFVRDNLFKPFHTTKGNAGMGIGAYESREVIRAMGGQLTVSSEQNKGTTITVCLPVDNYLVASSN